MSNSVPFSLVWPTVLLTLAMLVAAVMAGKLGAWFASRRDRRLGIGACIFALAVLTTVVLGLNLRRLYFEFPWSVILTGQRKWMVLAVFVPLLVSLLSGYVEAAKLRQLLKVVFWLCVFRMAVIPFAAPLVSLSELSRVGTIVDKDGVYLQGTNYTCGPAASVTALRMLGLKVEEGSLAMGMGSSKLTGTPDDVLAAGLRRAFGGQGLMVEHRYLETLAEAADWPVWIAVIRYKPFVDHFVTVMKMDAEHVTLGDPARGLRTMTRADFDKAWRHVAILMRRTEGRHGK